MLIKDNRLYIFYEGFEERYGHNKRFALLRYSVETEEIYNNRRHEYNQKNYLNCTIYVDGKKEKASLGEIKDIKNRPESIILLESYHGADDDTSMYNVVGRGFDNDSVEDWKCLFKDTIETYNNRCDSEYAIAFLLVTFDRFFLKINVIEEALNSFPDDIKSRLVILINNTAFGLCPAKIKIIKRLIEGIGLECPAYYPEVLEVAAAKCGIDYDYLKFHNLTDKLLGHENISELDDTSLFIRFLKWLNGDDIVLSLQDLNECFPYLGEEARSNVLRRFFLDVKTGRFDYNEESLKVFSSPKYRFYSKVRYIFESWPENRNMSIEFLLDCLNTYEKTKQERFQITNGILDWAIQKAIQIQRPIDLDFYDWLCYCDNGVIINKNFKGFADLYIQYEIDDLNFEDDSLQRNIESIISKHCTRLYHREEQPLIDSSSNEPIIDPQTGQPQTTSNIVYENKWKPKTDGDLKFIELFVNERDEREIQNVPFDNTTFKKDHVFTLEMIDYSIVRNRVEDYLSKKYNTLSPYISARSEEDVVRMFLCPVRMKAEMRDSAKIGVWPGVDEDIIKKRVLNRIKELFGESLECEFDEQKFNQAIECTLFNPKGVSDECFIHKTKYYSQNREIYCAPESVTERPNLITGHQCAICQKDLCFVTCIKKEPSWRGYKLLHILEIIGYQVLEETEAGYIPNKSYTLFVTQINKAIRFYKRLVCEKCGHILFPAKVNSFNRFKCLMPSCPDHDIEIYLSYCYECKKGLIDSRETKQCPNKFYICNDCGACCSNTLFEKMAHPFLLMGQPIPSYISRLIGNGHYDRNIRFCSKCGKQEVDLVTNTGTHEWRCPDCDFKDDVEEVEA